MGHGAPSASKQRIASTMGKARIFSEALPFIKQFRGTTAVVKIGGSAMVDEALRATFADDVAMLHYVGIRPVVVHGGGPHITRAMRARGIEPQWSGGLRVTDAETIKIVQSTLAGEINPDIVRLINAHGSLAAGVSGFDGNLFVARPMSTELGYVGKLIEVDPGLVIDLQDRGYVPVVAPLARGDDGTPYNVNADSAASALSLALNAPKLLYLTDVEGIYEDVEDEASLLSRSTVSELRDLVSRGAVSSGMLPKVEACIAAVEGGVARTHILDGRVQHALLLEIFTREGIGTMITADEVS